MSKIFKKTPFFWGIVRKKPVFSWLQVIKAYYSVERKLASTRITGT